jgi:multidrug efflux pump subunit AcrA (membrane-fusion protein)
MPQENTVVKLGRVIDFRLPLPWLLGGVIAVSWAFISMYFAVQTLVASVADLQVTVKSGNVSSSVLAGEVSLLRYRVESIEDELKARKQGAR